MQELIPINIVIADRTYRIKISPADEESVRGSLKTINDKVVEFKTQFVGKDMQDYVAMVLIWYATQSQTGPEENNNTGKEFADALLRFEQQIDKVL